MEWYKDEKHIGYDITGKKITKKEKRDKLDSFLATMDDSKNWSVSIFLWSFLGVYKLDSKHYADVS